MTMNKLLDHFTLHTVVSAVIAAISGLNIGWHISKKDYDRVSKGFQYNFV